MGRAVGTSEGVRGPQTTDCSRPNVVFRDCFPLSGLSPTRHRNTGQASLGYDLGFLCSEWVPVLSAFPAGNSTATPVLGLVGSPRWGSRASWSRVWNQECNRGAIELSAVPPPGCLRALSAGTGEAHASLGGVGIPGRSNCSSATLTRLAEGRPGRALK